MKRSLFLVNIAFLSLLYSCEKKQINNHNESAPIDHLKTDVNISRDSIKNVKKTEMKTFKESASSKPQLVQQINSSAPTILKSAQNNRLFNSEKWLKSDQNRFMKLHLGKISKYDKQIKKYSRRYGFDWRLIAAQIYTESNFRNEAKSHVGALGLMQIMPNTAKFMGYTPEKMSKPDVNIMVGCMYNQRMYNLWGRQTKNRENRLAFALASYNAGRGRVLKSYSTEKKLNTWKLVHPYLPQETQNYVHKIFLKYDFYKKRILP